MNLKLKRILAKTNLNISGSKMLRNAKHLLARHFFQKVVKIFGIFQVIKTTKLNYTGNL